MTLQLAKFYTIDTIEAFKQLNLAGDENNELCVNYINNIADDDRYYYFTDPYSGNEDKIDIPWNSIVFIKETGQIYFNILMYGVESHLLNVLSSGLTLCNFGDAFIIGENLLTSTDINDESLLKKGRIFSYFDALQLRYNYFILVNADTTSFGGQTHLLYIESIDEPQISLLNNNFIFKNNGASFRNKLSVTGIEAEDNLIGQNVSYTTYRSEWDIKNIIASPTTPPSNRFVTLLDTGLSDLPLGSNATFILQTNSHGNLTIQLNKIGNHYNIVINDVCGALIRAWNSLLYEYRNKRLIIKLGYTYYTDDICIYTNITNNKIVFPDYYNIEEPAIEYPIDIISYYLGLMDFPNGKCSHGFRLELNTQDPTNNYALYYPDSLSNGNN